MSSDCSFAVHIDAVVASTKPTISWILQTFQIREHLPMLTLWKTLLLPIVEYCLVLWSHTEVGHAQQIESLQWSFFRKIVAAGQVIGNPSLNITITLSKDVESATKLYIFG